MKYTIDVKNKQKASPYLYGLFFEDINHSLDGGLNANLVQNGNFEFSYFNYSSMKVERIFDHLRFWSCEPQKLVSVTDEKPIHNLNPHSLKIEIDENGGDAVLKNFGYELKDNSNYIYLSDSAFKCSFFYACTNEFSVDCYFEYDNGKTSKPLTLKLSPSEEYKPIEFGLVGKKGSYARLVFKVSGCGRAYLTNFRLLANNYFKSRKNAYKFGKFNAKLVESLRMGAKFLRFPGGCLVEGDVSPEYLYEWEKTIGPLENRVSKPSVWNYMQSNEIGFFEYFCLCEDLNLSPVPVHHVGLNCQIRTEVFRHEGYSALHPNSNEFKEKVIDSIAHLIYFAKGDVDSPDKVERAWAQKRKDMGHAKPFKLQFLALGNENWDKVYFRNFNAAVNALKRYDYAGKATDIIEKFGIQILSSAGVDINPQDTNLSWRYITQNYKDLIIDEHVYNTPEWFVDNFYRYDFYSPEESKVFMGEYACHTDADGKGLLGGKNNFTSALCEAVFMCGMENNPQIVKMSCYAPLFVKKYQANWYPDLIEFDKDKLNFTPNYMTQALFMQNYGKYSIRPEFDKSKKICGLFTLRKNQNQVEGVNFSSLSGKDLSVKLNESGESDRELESFAAQISFKDKAKNFSIGLAVNKRENFGFYLHYDRANNGLFVEKIVAGKRMTMEHLWTGDMPNQFKVVFDGKKIEVLIGRRTIAQKQVWKTTEKVFSSLTYDADKVYLKVVNISSKEEVVEVKFEKLFSNEKVCGKIVTLTQNESDEFDCDRRVRSTKGDAEKFAVKLQPKSINVVVLDRK